VDAKLTKQSLIVGGIGVVLQTAGYLWAVSQDRLFISVVDYDQYPPAAGAITIIGSIMLLAGLALYAQAKGRTRWWGLMGLFSIFGLVVLALLPDLRPTEDPKTGKPHLMARISVYLGAAAIVPVFGVVLGVLAIVCGLVALSMPRNHPELGGRQTAITGLTLGAVLLLLQVGAFFVMLNFAIPDQK
jgi:uncharacterized membrane protein HdeD (DUF308 family)